MINSISKLKSFGIFQDYKAAKDLKPFVQYNLFYGWNGSGKSTLAKVFLSITDKKTHSDFPDGEYTILVKDCPDITHKNVSQNNRNIKVFSKDFIERNVNFDQSKANSILILSEEKKEEMENYKSLLQDLMTKEGTYQSDKDKYDKAVEDLKKVLSRWASNVKKSFELIETANSYYLNYDRTKLSAFIKNNRGKISKNAILTQDEVKNLKNAIKPNQKPDVDASPFVQLSTDTIKKQIEEIEEILSTSIFSQQITRLTSNPDINQWVKDGLTLHEKHKSNNCEFCGQVIPDKRIDELNNHFSKAYDDLILKISKFTGEINKLIETVSNSLPDSGDLYDELHPQYDIARNSFANLKASCLSKLEEAIDKLSEKNKNPFIVISHKFTDIEKTITDYNDGLKVVTDVITSHNLKNQGFDEAVKKAQSSLELHFVSELLVSENYDKTEEDMQLQKQAIELKDKELGEIRAEVAKLEAVLLNEAVGAEDFNRNLTKFLGRKDISLVFDRSLKGYKIMRKGKTQPARNLSEGEKTAIALVYFVAKLKENGNDIKKTIVVLDDPISSFDSNHLFHSYSYLKQECEQAEQLFILTHNFQYFKLIRDWLLNKNERKWNSDGSYEDRIRTNCYSIDCSVEEDRKATINNASNTLLKYNSEYHYIFSKLLVFKDITTIDLEKAFLIANISRKLLESFLTFKFPKGRKSFDQLLQAGCSDKEMKDKIYRFINKYSHNQVIDYSDGPIDNLLGEGNAIVKAVLQVVENLDNTHYSEMVEVCA